jgi:hypothetical protein
VASGTGSGKTLPMALTILLDDPADHWITITISPLKHLQVTQKSDFNQIYGIRTVEKGSFPLSTTLPDRRHNCMDPERDELPEQPQRPPLSISSLASALSTRIIHCQVVVEVE